MWPIEEQDSSNNMAEPRPDINRSSEANFAYGLRTVEFPELGKKHEGKVRDYWEVGDKTVFVTTDRQSAYDAIVGTIPGKGKALNETSAWWAKNTADIIPNDVIAIPHPNVKIARRAAAMIPVEMVFRRYMARSSTSTSIFKNYSEGRRNIYGIDFPQDLQPNQPFPEDLGKNGVIFTPTTKPEKGAKDVHDEEMTEEQARELIKGQFGSVIADQVIQVGYKLFIRGVHLHGLSELIFVDTKYEFGIDQDGRLMVADEINTPEASRIWKADSYEPGLKEGLDPESFDKEILRRWLAKNGFTGEIGQSIPVIPEYIKTQMLYAYSEPYRLLSGQNVSVVSSNPLAIRRRVLDYFNAS